MAVYSIRPGSDNGRQAYITGNQGRYDELVENNGVRYARNAINNFHKYASYRMPKTEYPKLDDISKLSDDQFEQRMAQLDEALQASDKVLKDMPPLDYTVKYLPGKTNYDNIDTIALIGAAFEDMGKKSSLGTFVLTSKLQKTFDSENISADVLDLNKDGKIDTGEYATSILAADMLSKGGLEVKTIDGKITQKGHMELLSLFNKKNNRFASSVFNFLHGFYALDSAKDSFSKNPNNRVK